MKLVSMLHAPTWERVATDGSLRKRGAHEPWAQLASVLLHVAGADLRAEPTSPNTFVLLALATPSVDDLAAAVSAPPSTQATAIRADYDLLCAASRACNGDVRVMTEHFATLTSPVAVTALRRLLSAPRNLRRVERALAQRAHRHDLVCFCIDLRPRVGGGATTVATDSGCCGKRWCRHQRMRQRHEADARDIAAAAPREPRFADAVLVVVKPWTLCMVCHGPATKRCGGCDGVRYCSVDCQAAAWPAHKALCGRAAE